MIVLASRANVRHHRIRALAAKPNHTFEFQKSRQPCWRLFCASHLDGQTIARQRIPDDQFLINLETGRCALELPEGQPLLR